MALIKHSSRAELTKQSVIINAKRIGPIYPNCDRTMLSIPWSTNNTKYYDKFPKEIYFCQLTVYGQSRVKLVRLSVCQLVGFGFWRTKSYLIFSTDGWRYSWFVWLNGGWMTGWMDGCMVGWSVDCFNGPRLG